MAHIVFFISCGPYHMLCGNRAFLETKNQFLVTTHFNNELESFDYGVTYYFSNGKNQPPGADWLK